MFQTQHAVVAMDRFPREPTIAAPATLPSSEEGAHTLADIVIDAAECRERTQAKVARPTLETDAMHALLMLRSDAIERCTENSPEEAVLMTIADALEAGLGISHPRFTMRPSSWASFSMWHSWSRSDDPEGATSGQPAHRSCRRSKG